MTNTEILSITNLFVIEVAVVGPCGSIKSVQERRISRLWRLQLVWIPLFQLESDFHLRHPYFYLYASRTVLEVLLWPQIGDEEPLRRDITCHGFVKVATIGTVHCITEDSIT